MRNDRAHRAALPRASDPDAIGRVSAAGLRDPHDRFPGSHLGRTRHHLTSFTHVVISNTIWIRLRSHSVAEMSVKVSGMTDKRAPRRSLIPLDSTCQIVLYDTQIFLLDETSPSSQLHS